MSCTLQEYTEPDILIVQSLEKYDIRVLRMPGHTVLTAKSDPYHLPSVPYIVAARMSAISQ